MMDLKFPSLKTGVRRGGLNRARMPRGDFAFPRGAGGMAFPRAERGTQRGSGYPRPHSDFGFGGESRARSRTDRLGGFDVPMSDFGGGNRKSSAKQAREQQKQQKELIKTAGKAGSFMAAGAGKIAHAGAEGARGAWNFIKEKREERANAEANAREREVTEAYRTKHDVEKTKEWARKRAQQKQGESKEPHDEEKPKD